MTRNPLRSSAGFTYIAALAMVVIMGIMLSQMAVVWSTKMKREREVELLFRGTQIRDALRRFYGFTLNPYGATPQPGVTVATGTKPPVTTFQPNTPRINELKDLLKAPGSAGTVRYLRGSEKGPNMVDPITGKDWALVKDPTTQRIIGVASTSEAAPLKQANFPFDLEPQDFEAKKKYNEWQFICTRYPKPAAAGGGVTGLPPDTPPAAPGTPGIGH